MFRRFVVLLALLVVAPALASAGGETGNGRPIATAR